MTHLQAWAGAVGRQDLPVATKQKSAAGKPRATSFQIARSVVASARWLMFGCESEVLEWLDEHMLSDIGLVTDGIRRDIRRGPWPN